MDDIDWNADNRDAPHYVCGLEKERLYREIAALRAEVAALREALERSKAAFLARDDKLATLFGLRAEVAALREELDKARHWRSFFDGYERERGMRIRTERDLAAARATIAKAADDLEHLRGRGEVEEDLRAFLDPRRDEARGVP